jgi:hypothetical protein
MRKFLIPFAIAGGAALVALPVAAQQREQAAQQREENALRGGAEAVRQAAPMLDRSTDSALNLDIGPLLDALHPYGPRGRHMTLRQLGRSNDPEFDNKLRRSIYRGSARASATLDAMATAAPSIRQSLRQMEAAIAGAVVDARRPLPPQSYGPPRGAYDSYDPAPAGNEDGPPPPPPSDDEDDDGAPW